MKPSGLVVSRALLLGVLLGTAAACAPTWTPESGTAATSFNVPPDAQRAFERARLSEKSGDRYGAELNYDEAARSGHPMILLFEARYYLRGPDNRNPAKAKAALEQAVLVPSEWQGDAQFLLGKMLVRGDDGVPTEPERGEELLEKAAEAGVAPAAAELARTLERRGSDDTARIDALWAAAAEAGDEQAVVRTAERQIAAGKTRAEIPDVVSRAMASLNARAEAGDVNAMRSLSKIYAQGTLAPQDKALSILWLERAVEAGDAGAATALARAMRGTGRIEERVDLLTAAAEAGDAVAAGRLAKIYLEGDGVPANAREAERWAAPAIEGGDTVTMARFGRAYVEGRGLDQDVPRGLQMLEEAQAQGDTLASAYLARIYLRAEDVPPDPKKATRYAEEAVAADYVFIKTAYGRALLDGKNVPQDRARAITLLREAAEAGDGLANAELGAAYLEGKGVPKDVNAAVPLLEAGAAAGNASAMNALARVLLDSESPYHDEAAGIALLRQAAEAGHSSAMLALGRAYMDGQGVAKDPAQARAWLEKAKAAGRGDADRLIAQLPAS